MLSLWSEDRVPLNASWSHLHLWEQCRENNQADDCVWEPRANGVMIFSVIKTLRSKKWGYVNRAFIAPVWKFHLKMLWYVVYTEKNKWRIEAVYFLLRLQLWTSPESLHWQPHPRWGQVLIIFIVISKNCVPSLCCTSVLIYIFTWLFDT